MNQTKLLIAVAFSLTLIGCGGGGGGGDEADGGQAQQPDNTDSSPPTSEEEPAEETLPDIELATVPELQGFEEMVPPGVPRLN